MGEIQNLETMSERATPLRAPERVRGRPGARPRVPNPPPVGRLMIEDGSDDVNDTEERGAPDLPEPRLPFITGAPPKPLISPPPMTISRPEEPSAESPASPVTIADSRLTDIQVSAGPSTLTYFQERYQAPQAVPVRVVARRMLAQGADPQAVRAIAPAVADIGTAIQEVQALLSAAQQDARLRQNRYWQSTLESAKRTGSRAVRRLNNVI